MERTRVRLPPGVGEPFTVYVNGVRQELGRDFEVRGGALVFRRELVKERKLGPWRWFLGAWGIGTYGRNDQVDVAWEHDGQPRVAHALDIEPAGAPGHPPGGPPVAPSGHAERRRPTRRG